MEKYKFKPIKISLAYSLLTIFLFEFGVIDFRHGDKLVMYLFLAYAHIGILFGYYCGIHSKNGNAYTGSLSGQKLLLSLFRYAFVIYLITFIPAFCIETKTYSFNISSIIQKIEIGFSDSTILYNELRNADNVSGVWRIINYGVVLTGFVRWTFFPLAIYLWDKLKTTQKVFFWIFAVTFLLSYFTKGTTAGIFTIAFIVGVPFIMRRERKLYLMSSHEEPQKKSKKKRLLTFIIVGLVLFACLWVFSNNMRSREASLYEGNGDFSHFPWFLIPPSIRAAVYWLTGYVAQGYMSLSFCLELPFTPTFGVGGSWFTLQNFSDLLGINILQYTYIGKAEQFGIGAYHNWHTVYPWIASDVSFVGAPIILFILFYQMAQSWRDYLDHNDGFAFIFMTIMGFFVLYISANNTVFTHSDTLFSFYIVLYLWKHCRKKYFYET